MAVVMDSAAVMALWLDQEQARGELSAVERATFATPYQHHEARTRAAARFARAEAKYRAARIGAR